LASNSTNLTQIDQIATEKMQSKNDRMKRHSSSVIHHSSSFIHHSSSIIHNPQFFCSFDYLYNYY